MRIGGKFFPGGCSVKHACKVYSCRPGSFGIYSAVAYVQDIRFFCL